MEAIDNAGTHDAGKVSGLERSALRRVLALLDNPPIELVLWNGEVISAGRGKPAARLRIQHRGLLLRLLYRPDLYFGEAYSHGDIEVEGDLVKLLEYVDPLEQRGARRRLWERLKLRFPLLELHALAHARSNIHHHYDISNAFYRLWLDRDLIYTCAYFPTSATSLDEAQQAKMDYVCRKLRLKPGETVVEAGCGWGALARYMAKHYGVKVRAYNIAREQIAYTRERARQEGLEHWLSRYESVVDEVRLMFDETFVRSWRLYLAGSIAGFHTGSLQLFRITFNRVGINDVPWTRDYLYGL